MSSTPASTALRLTGRDVVSVLHRVCTQKLLDLPVGTSRTTLLCDFRGRLQHRFVVARMPDESVWLLRSDAPGAELATAIDRSVFREDVRIEDLSHVHPVRAWQGTAHDAGLSHLVTREGGTIPSEVCDHAGVRLVVGDIGAEELARATVPMDALAAIRGGWARQGFEIVEDFNPFEVGLAQAVHLDKGCFTGQESLQRLITYSSVRRQLVAVEGDGTAPSAPQQVLSAAEDAGRLTSSAHADEGWMGLVVVRRSMFDAGVALTLADGTALRVIRAFEPGRPLGRP